MHVSGFQDVLRHLPFLLTGVRWTLELSVMAIIGGSLVGILLGLMRTSRIRPLRWFAALYVDFMRTTPLLVQLVWIYYALPILIGQSLESIPAGALGLSLFEGAYLAEIVRAGILSVERGQGEAALALGMRPHQVLRRVVLPQALSRMVPPITNQFILTIKDSSLGYVISVPELMFQASSLGAVTLAPLEALTTAAVVYLGMTYPLSVLVGYLGRRSDREAPQGGRRMGALWRRGQSSNPVPGAGAVTR
jgi:polar amino acid transport system permease protein